MSELLITVTCPVPLCHMGSVGWASEKETETARTNYMKEMQENHSAGGHDKYNSIIDNEPDVNKRDWSKL